MDLSGMPMGEKSFWRPSWGHVRSESHARYLGILWADLHALETALRIVLCEIELVPNLQRRLHALYEAKVGEAVSDDHFTKHNQLHHLIAAFNDFAVPRGSDPIDADIGHLRHALAHGRVTAISDEHDFRLINFKRIKGSDPVLCYSAVMTPAWFKLQRKRVRASTKGVHSFSESLQRPRPREIIVVGNATEEDVARVLRTEEVGVTSSARFLVIVGQDVPEENLAQLRESAERIGKVVRL